jgi:hypothetical protein
VIFIIIIIIMSVFLKNLDLSKIKPARRRSGSKSKKSTRKDNKKGSVAQVASFPTKLYQMLQEVEQQGLDSIVSWQHDGRSFRVHKPETFVSDILPSYFRCSKMKSFQRQLNFYKFHRIIGGPLDGSYAHPQFIKGDEDMAKKIRRQELSTHSEETSQHDDARHENNKNESGDGLSIVSEEEEEVVASESVVATSENDHGQHLGSPSDDDDDDDDCLQALIESEFTIFEQTQHVQDIFMEGSRLSFVGKKFFFLPVEFTDLYGMK